MGNLGFGVIAVLIELTKLIGVRAIGLRINEKLIVIFGVLVGDGLRVFILLEGNEATVD